MPLYEYRCEACGESEEKLEGIAAPDHHDCPACGGAGSMHRQISLSAFKLEGSGWYAQGYGKGGISSSPKAEAPKTPGCCGGSCSCH